LARPRDDLDAVFGLRLAEGFDLLADLLPGLPFGRDFTLLRAMLPSLSCHHSV
jgi:hypothetical protein